jgi:type II secretory pathway pseudopilin PulG
MRTRPLTHRPPPARGLSIAEVLLSLAIVSMLLVGVAAAYTAASNAVDGNDRFFRATQAARVSMTQLLTEIRRADKVDTAGASPYNTVFVTRDPELRLPEEQWREFKYDSVTRTITLQIIFKKVSDGTIYKSDLYTLCRNVEEASFGPAAKVGTVEVSIPVTVVIKSNGHTIRLSDTSGPRRAM